MMKRPWKVWFSLQLDIHESVHRDTIMKVTNKMQLYRLIYFIIPSQLYMFRAMFSPIIRSTSLYLQYLVVFTQVAAGCETVSTHPRHQPAATCVNTTRYCKYSQVLLIMGEKIARNM